MFFDEIPTKGKYIKLPKVEAVYAHGHNLAYKSYELQDAYQCHDMPHDTQIINPKGELASYHVHRLVSNEPGLNAFAFVPKDNHQHEVKIAFRGTQDLSSLARDLEYSGAGADSFAIEKQHLITQIDDITTYYYGKEANDIHLTISGHSLGGSDAEHMACAVLESKAHQQGLESINGVTLYHFNSPGISHESAEQSVQDIRAIKNQDPDFTVDVYQTKVANDGIQQLGYNHFLNGAVYEQANVHLLNIQKYDPVIEEVALLNPGYAVAEAILGTIFSHQMDGVFDIDDEGQLVFDGYSYDYFTNDTPEHTAEISAQLSHKCTWLMSTFSYSNYLLASAMKTAAHYLNQSAHSVKEDIKTLRCEILQMADILSDHNTLSSDLDPQSPSSFALSEVVSNAPVQESLVCHTAGISDITNEHYGLDLLV